MVDYNSLLPIEQDILAFRNEHPVMIIMLIIIFIVAIVLAYRFDRKNEQARISKERKEVRAYIKERNKRFYQGF